MNQIFVKAIFNHFSEGFEGFDWITMDADGCYMWNYEPKIMPYGVVIDRSRGKVFSVDNRLTSDETMMWKRGDV